MGVPVVAGRKSSAVPWTLAQDAAGLLVDINRPAAIAVGIGQTLTLLEATQQRVAYAHPYVRATFAIPRIAELYMQEFEHILKDGKG
jgi:glycosyltransferase involved in cell wall biosynthesis